MGFWLSSGTVLGRVVERFRVSSGQVLGKKFLVLTGKADSETAHGFGKVCEVQEL